MLYKFEEVVRLGKHWQVYSDCFVYLKLAASDLKLVNKQSS